MTSNETGDLPTFLGIQLSSGDVIPIIVRYIGKQKIVFSLPEHNAKEPYTVSGHISEDIDLNSLKIELGPYLVGFTEDEKQKLKTNNLYKDNQQTTENIIPNQMQNNYGYKFPTTHSLIPDDDFFNQPSAIENPLASEGYISEINAMNERVISLGNTVEIIPPPPPKLIDPPTVNYSRDYSAINETTSEKLSHAENLYVNGLHLIDSDPFNGDVSVKGLHMLRQAQIIYNQVYPESYSRIVLPGTCQRMIHSVDPDAHMMHPKQFRSFMKRRLKLAQLREKGLIGKRTSGVLYPSRSRAAQNRVRNELGVFVK